MTFDRKWRERIEEKKHLGGGAVLTSQEPWRASTQHGWVRRRTTAAGVAEDRKVPRLSPDRLDAGSDECPATHRTSHRGKQAFCPALRETR